MCGVHWETWDRGWDLQTVRGHLKHPASQVLQSDKPLKILHSSRLGEIIDSFKNTELTVCVCVCRQEFCSEACPDLTKEVYLQDIHCVGSLCKLYFRELPNPLLTYELYNKFTVSIHSNHICCLHWWEEEVVVVVVVGGVIMCDCVWFDSRFVPK